MDRNTAQQVEYAKLFLGRWLMKGSKIWSFSYVQPVLTDAIVYGKRLNTEELSNIALESKRHADYASAVGAYIKIMAAYEKQTGQIPLAHARGFFKVLVAANEFAVAFDLVRTALADIQERKNEVDPQEMMLFDQYFKQLVSVSVDFIDNNNIEFVIWMGKNYSGNNTYSLFLSYDEIRSRLQYVRNQVKQVYGI